ncbi:MAG: TIGR03936 family radical SAM-associated protein [Anaerolineae bacterium]
MRTEVAQRLRVTFGVEEPLSYASVLDMGRVWERLLRRAGVPIAYSQGFNPQPRMQFAAALPVGYTSTCEVVDLLLAEHVEPAAFLEAARTSAPKGLHLIEAAEVPLHETAPQSTMHSAHYRVDLRTPATAQTLRDALDALMASTSVPRQRIKKGRLAEYDLRPLILSVDVLSAGEGGYALQMILSCGPNGAGRPEEVINSLGLPEARYAIRRTQLLWGLEEGGK